MLSNFVYVFVCAYRPLSAQVPSDGYGQHHTGEMIHVNALVYNYANVTERGL
jgi:hypothetical protein